MDVGLLGKLFGKEKNSTGLIKATLKPSIIDIQNMNVHEDLCELLWLIDGPKKNYEPKQNKQVYDLENGMRFTISFTDAIEPSAISLKLPIDMSCDDRGIERPNYYPTYAGLTPEQRGKYWRVLENPYDVTHDIGYIFILYYGLERQLFKGKYEKAYKVILKLRDTHANKSFQSYSGCALVLAAMLHQKPEMIINFCGSLDKEYEYNFSDNLFLLCKSSLGLPLFAEELMRMAKTFEFTNNNYIKKYPTEFANELKQVIFSKNGKEFIDINSYITKNE